MSQGFVLANDRMRERAIDAVRKAADGSAVEIKSQDELQRTIPQNAVLHGLLSDIANQAIHPILGVKLSVATWKVLLLHKFGKEVEIVPSLDGSEAIAIGHTRDLKRKECTAFMTFIEAEGSELGVIFTDRRRDVA